MDMLQSIQAGAARYGGCAVHSKGAHAKDRGEDPSVRVSKVDRQQGAHNRAANGTSQVSPTDHWRSAPTTHGSPHVVRHLPQEGKMRKRRQDQPQMASPLFGALTADTR